MSIQFTNSKVVVSEVFCDFITFTVQYESAAERSTIRKRMSPDCLKAIGYLAYQGGARRYYKLGAHVRVDMQSEHTVRLHCDPWADKTAFFRVEFNPAKISLIDAKILIERVLGDEWSAIIAKARVTRVDATVDIANVQIDQLLLSVPKVQVSRLFCKGGATQTYELGCLDGDRRIKFYDKRAEIMAKNNKQMLKDAVPEMPLTRCEVRLTPEVRFSELEEIENPFLKVRVQDYALLPKCDEQVFRLFKAVAQSRGAQDALAMLDLPERKQIKLKLESAACPWWNPDEIWSGWHPELAKLGTPPPLYIAAAA